MLSSSKALLPFSLCYLRPGHLAMSSYRLRMLQFILTNNYGINIINETVKYFTSFFGEPHDSVQIIRQQN